MKKLLNVAIGVGLAVAALFVYEKMAKLKYEALFNEILDEANLF